MVSGAANLLGGLVELAVGLEVKVDVDEVGSSKKLRIVSDLIIEARMLGYLLRTWKTMPEEMIGVIPNSMRVPLLLAIIILSQ